MFHLVRTDITVNPSAALSSCYAECGECEDVLQTALSFFTAQCCGQEVQSDTLWKHSNYTTVASLYHIRSFVYLFIFFWWVIWGLHTRCSALSKSVVILHSTVSLLGKINVVHEPIKRRPKWEVERGRQGTLVVSVRQLGQLGASNKSLKIGPEVSLLMSGVRGQNVADWLEAITCKSNSQISTVCSQVWPNRIWKIQHVHPWSGL